MLLFGPFSWSPFSLWPANQTWSLTQLRLSTQIGSCPLLHIPGSLLCPVKAYRNMCRLVPLDGKHPAFALKSSRGPVPVTYQQFNQKLKKLVGACGLNPDNFSTHSFPRGGATCAFRADVPETLIQLQGVWASDCYKRYLEMGLAEKRAVSLRLAKHITKKCHIWCGRLYCCVIKILVIEGSDKRTPTFGPSILVCGDVFICWFYDMLLGYKQIFNPTLRSRSSCYLLCSACRI